MRRLNRFTGVAVLLFFGLSLAALSFFSLLAQAQEPIPFEIQIIPQAEYAVSGQPLTYTVLVTNVSQVAVQNALIKVKVPPGTSLVEALSPNPNWYSNNPPPGVIRDEAIWLTPNAVAPGEVIYLQMVVKPFAELTQPEIINDTSSVGIAAEGGPEIVTTGAPVEIPLFTPTPGPSATPTATFTPTVFVSPTSTSTPRETATTVPTLDTTSVAGAATNIPVPGTRAMSTVQLSPESVDDSSFTLFIFIGLVIVGIVGGLIWFLRKNKFMP